MSVITFFSFRSIAFIMAFVIFDREKDINNQFYYFLPKIVLFII